MNKEEFTLLVTKVGLSVADIEGSIAELLKLKPELAATEEATPAEGAAEKDEEASPVDTYFTLLDADGDGLLCDQGNGLSDMWMTLADGNGWQHGGKLSADFSIEQMLG